MRCVSPASTVTSRSCTDSRSTLVIRVKSIVIPPRTALTWPSSELPMPKGITGTRSREQAATMAATSVVVSGNATASGGDGSCHDSPCEWWSRTAREVVMRSSSRGRSSSTINRQSPNQPRKSQFAIHLALLAHMRGVGAGESTGTSRFSPHRAQNARRGPGSRRGKIGSPRHLSMPAAALVIRRPSHNRLYAGATWAIVAIQGRSRTDRCEPIFSAPFTPLKRSAPVDSPCARTARTG